MHFVDVKKSSDVDLYPDNFVAAAARENKPTETLRVDIERLRSDVVEVTRRVVGEAGDVGAIVLEMTILHAFSDDIVLYMTGERGVGQTRIAFVRDHGGTREIHLIDYDGQNEEQSTRMKTIVLSPAWAPGGDRLAFTSFGGGLTWGSMLVEW